jgi:uncharacterized protein (DUF2062 family)
MMFRRRVELSPLRKFREHLWPRAGFKRSFRYNVHRLRRIDDSAYGIAAGLACGVGVAFTPFIGFHFVFAMLLAWLIRGNIIAAALGTLVGNPWTYPFTFLWTYEVGHWLLGGKAVSHIPEDITLLYLIRHPWRILLPMTVGGIPTALVAWVVTFFPARILIERSRGIRRARLEARAAENRRSAAEAKAR